ncbi:hypothetical protein BJ508DRAFT_344380 [Ascobolus immersus RN42]|uniref:F-box domain-containing protein n=1 Tax=Ascobolus immersus RN42 TaxID=1160509 RepID=A0A3N4HAP7_ASCIM|nr:hypothetical protein BJ508DRAFT_344380 [Ascobolus immersus RN42]
MDFLPVLPLELCHQILSHLANEDLVICTGVSRTWHHCFRQYCVSVRLRQLRPVPAMLERQNIVEINAFNYFCNEAYERSLPVFEGLSKEDKGHDYSRFIRPKDYSIHRYCADVDDYDIIRGQKRTLLVAIVKNGTSWAYDFYLLFGDPKADENITYFESPSPKEQLHLPTLLLSNPTLQRNMCTSCVYASSFRLLDVLPKQSIAVCERQVHCPYEDYSRPVSKCCCIGSSPFLFGVCLQRRCVIWSILDIDTRQPRAASFESPGRQLVSNNFSRYLVEFGERDQPNPEKHFPGDLYVCNWSNGGVEAHYQATVHDEGSIRRESLLCFTSGNYVISARPFIVGALGKLVVDIRIFRVRSRTVLFYRRLELGSADEFNLVGGNLESAFSCCFKVWPGGNEDNSGWKHRGPVSYVRQEACSSSPVVESCKLYLNLFRYYEEDLSLLPPGSLYTPPSPVIWTADIVLTAPPGSSPEFHLFPSAYERYPTRPTVSYHNMSKYTHFLEPSRRTFVSEYQHQDVDLIRSLQSYEYFGPGPTESLFYQYSAYNFVCPNTRMQANAWDVDGWPPVSLEVRLEKHWYDYTSPVPMDDSGYQPEEMPNRELLGVDDNFIKFVDRIWPL